MKRRRLATTFLAVPLSLCACGTAASTAPATSTVPASPIPETTAAVSSTTSVASTTTSAGTNDFTSFATSFAAAESRWSQAGLASYELVIAEHRNYWSKGCTWTSVVTDGIVTDTAVTPSPESGGECSESEYTVEQLHETIASGLRDIKEFSDPEFGEHTLEATYNDLGVPTSIEYDLANGGDEEMSMRVTFTPLR